ncbi:MAG TPA: hypothetical protein VMK42_14265 [Anaeromyxobacteraceae bacterium]|nr:hypothetical protein [Anaeromyxobacteraceae bacterium]
MRNPWKALLAATIAFWPLLPFADYSGCESCHSPTVQTCNGCHSHGTHSSVSMEDINVAGTTDAANYAPSATVRVTVNGGWQSGWVRVLLLDHNLTELARSSCPGGMGGCTTSVFPVTLTAPAPVAPGSYTWAVAWYGNQADKAGGSFGAGTSSTLRVGYFTPDANNANHGYQVVALPSFTVDAVGLAPATSDAAPKGGCNTASGSVAPVALLLLLLPLGRGPPVATAIPERDPRRAPRREERWVA